VNREVFRLGPPLILWWVWVAFAVANVADFAIQGAPARFAIVVSAILVTITGLSYALALRPRVIAEPSGLTIVNPFRDHHVPWAAITAVDTGEWVRVHHTVGQPSPVSPQSSAASKAVSCWALYISARTKRRAARPPRPAPRPRSGLLRTLSLSSAFATPGPEPGYTEKSRLPEEAKYLASLPPAKAIAVRLDTRAGRERARPGADPETPENPVTARWAWLTIAAVVLPALALLIVVLA
jgi:Bacterial PH domain